MRSALRKSFSFRRQKKDEHDEKTDDELVKKEMAVVAPTTTKTPAVSTPKKSSRQGRKPVPSKSKRSNRSAIRTPPCTPATPVTPASDKHDDDETSRTKPQNSPHSNLSSKNNASRTPLSPPRLSPAESTQKTPHTSLSSKNKQHRSSVEKRANARIQRITKAAAALDSFGNELFERGDYVQAMATYSRALRLKKRTINVQLEELDKEEEDIDAESMEHVGTADRPESPQSPDTTKTTTTASTAATANDDDEEEQDPDDSVDASTTHLLASVATSINNIGYLRQRSGATPDEIMKAYHDSLNIKREVLGDRHLSVGKTLNNIGSVYFSTRQFEPALDSYTDALAILQQHLGTDHLDCATVHSNMGDVFMAQKDGRRAHECYQQALEIRWKSLGEHDTKVVRLLEKIAAIEMDQERSFKYHRPEKIEDDEDTDTALAYHDLHTAVRDDISYMDKMRRQMALDMVKDKLRIMRGMRNISLDDSYGLDDETEEDSTKKSPSLSPLQRKEALESVKGRLARLKELKASGMPLSDLSGNNSRASSKPGANVDIPALGKMPSKRNLNGLIGS